MFLAGVGVAVAGTASADVVVHLQSGGTIRADRSWTEGDTVHVQMGNDVATFATSAIQSIEQIPGTDKPADAAAAGAATDRPAGKTAEQPAPSKPAEAHAAAAPSKPAAPKVDPVPRVEGEDAATKLERIAALSMKTHRELSIARRQGKSADELKQMEEKIDEINDQRRETMRKLGMKQSPADPSRSVFNRLLGGRERSDAPTKE
jgi:hypothetical protein